MNLDNSRMPAAEGSEVLAADCPTRRREREETAKLQGNPEISQDAHQRPKGRGQRVWGAYKWALCQAHQMAYLNGYVSTT